MVVVREIFECVHALVRMDLLIFVDSDHVRYDSVISSKYEDHRTASGFHCAGMSRERIAVDVRIDEECDGWMTSMLSTGHSWESSWIV